MCGAGELHSLLYASRTTPYFSSFANSRHECRIMASYFLTRHVFIRIVEDHAIFLDLKRNEYSTISAADTGALSALVVDWPRTGGNVENSDVLADAETTLLVQQLLDAGVLTADAQMGKSAAPVNLPKAICAVAPTDRPLKITTQHVANFLGACAYSAMILKLGLIERAVRRVQRLRASNSKQKSTAAGENDADSKVQELVQIFNYLSAFGFTSSKRCLLISMALLEFLSRYGCHPAWVFGVQLRPFIAHCWVQDGRRVLNGTVSFTGDFAPILIV